MTISVQFAMWCIAGLIVSLLCVVNVRKRKDKIARTIEKILWLVIVAVIASIVLAFLSTSRTAPVEVFFGIRYSCMLWVCYFMVEYVCLYTKPKTHVLWIDDVWKIVLLADTLSLMLNVKFGHAMVCKKIIIDHEMCWVAMSRTGHWIHVGICVIMVLEVIVRLVIALLRCPVPYRGKYGGLLVAFIVTSFSTIYYQCRSDTLDISVLFLVAGMVVLVYNSFYFVPVLLRRRLLQSVFSEMKDTMVMFDNKGNCVYLNNKWSQNDVVLDMKQDVFHAALEKAHDAQSAICVTYGDEVRYYEDRYDELRDKDGKHVGSYYIFRDITEEQKLLRVQHYLANFDKLTGLYNRERFLRFAGMLMKEMPDEQFVIVCTDIYKFNVINEVFGIAIGDELLKILAQAVAGYTQEKCVYGRLDADTFALCIPEQFFDAERFGDAINNAAKTLDINYPVINHIGIYRVENRSLSVSAMCDRAMLAVNSIKTDYMRDVVYYDENLRKNLLAEQGVLADLEKAFEEKQFVMFLQPQYNHNTGLIIGSEALVRWNHPKKGLVPPKEFIPLLEQNGLITRLDMYVWEMACKQLQQWKNEGKEGRSISVNISNKDFFYIDIYEVLTGLVEKYGINVSDLKLEITESAFSIDMVKQLEIIEKLQERGFIIEMDDFGSGYSSLNSLKDVPVNVLKMDMIFMAKSDRYKRSEYILQTIITMANKLQMPVIAEGVETKEQADFLSGMGCEIIQGYYYAKPMPVEEFEKLYEKSNGGQ